MVCDVVVYLIEEYVWYVGYVDLFWECVDGCIG